MRIHTFLPRTPLVSVRLIVIALCILLSLAGAVSAQQQPQNAEQVFKNIQALKGISAADFMSAMGVMTAALGFDCSDCHTGAGTDKVNWEFDTPRKRMARRMVTMVTNLNRENFGGRQVVTCWTCHRGRDKPLVTPTVDTIYTPPTIEPEDVFRQAEGQPEPDPIVDKFVNAIGGAQRWAGITSIAGRGNSLGFGGFGGGGKVQFYAKAPDQRTTVIEFENATRRDANTRSTDGKSGWVKTPLSVLGEYQLIGEELEGARFDAQITFLGRIKQLVRNLRTGLPATLNDREVQVVQGETATGMVVTLYFDTQTGLLSRVVRYSKSPIGRVPTQMDFSDYREVRGVKIPHKWTFAWLDGRDSIELQDVQVNGPIDAAKFGRQAAR